MGRGQAGGRSAGWILSGVTLVLVTVLIVPNIGVGGVPPIPVLPNAVGGTLLTNVSAPPIGQGSTGRLSFRITNPLSVPLADVEVAWEVYAFNAFPGNATGPVPQGALSIAGSTSGGTSANLSLGNLNPGQETGATLEIVSSSAAPAGAYAVRSQVSFRANSSTYLFRSIGWFSKSEWTNATTGPSGTPVLNLSRLGVSGVTPETAVVVTSASIQPLVVGLFAAAAVLASLGGYLAVRRRPGSKSGSTGSAAPQSAERALGKSRNSEGD